MTCTTFRYYLRDQMNWCHWHMDRLLLGNRKGGFIAGLVQVSWG